MTKFSQDIFLLSFGLLIAIFIGLQAQFDKTYPPEHLIGITHLVQQPDDITCGPTTMCMMMSYYGLEKEIDEIKKITKTVWYSFSGRDFGMTAPVMIQSGLNYFNFNSKLKYGNIKNLKHMIGLGKPCIVLVRSGEWNWHYILVYGYNKDYIFFVNPSSGELEGLSSDEFAAAWSWYSDLRGRDCGFLPKNFLKSLEIYPNSYIYVE